MTVKIMHPVPWAVVSISLAALLNPTFSLTDIPAAFVGTVFIFGGALTFFKPEAAMLEFGLPTQRAANEAAQAVWPIHGSRVQIHGLAIWIFYLQGKLEEVDVLLAVLFYMGIVDWYICARENVPGFFRFFAGLVLGAWGAFGMTARGSH